MDRIAVLGSAGTIERIVVSEQLARGIDVVVLVDAATDGFVTPRCDVPASQAPVVAVAGGDELAERLSDVEGVLAADAPDGFTPDVIAEASIRAGRSLVDLRVDPCALRRLYERDADARAAGVRIVPGASAIGDLLAAVAARGVVAASDVHVAYAFPRAGGPRVRVAVETRTTMAAALRSSVLALRDGRLAEESPGETRRLAWFPRPVGPRHAAAVPGAEPLTLPRHLDTVRNAGVYVALPTWRAEILQAYGNATRHNLIRRIVDALVTRGLDDLADDVRSATSWGVVAEAADGAAVSRAWAHGRDPYGTAAALALGLLDTSASAAPGVLAPAQACEPADLLDALAATTSLRWGATRTSRGA